MWSHHGTFVSEKINKVRWRPDAFNNSHFFLTGSVDNDINSIKLYDFIESQEESYIYPYLVSTYTYSGDVTEIKFINSDIFVSSSSSGDADLFRIDNTVEEQPQIRREITWNKLHSFKNGENSPCTSLAVYDNDIATVGENGGINLLNTESARVIRKIDDADSCSLHSVIFSKHNEVLASNLNSQLKLWDLRSTDNKPSNTFLLPSDQHTPTCLTYHPTQRHLILVGDEKGLLTSWDLRQNNCPINILKAHDSAVTEIQFHPENSDQMFSCSNSGDIWFWSNKTKKQISDFQIDADASVWFVPGNVQSKLEVFTLMPVLQQPINSLDINRSKVICGGDNEAVYLINDVTL